MDVLPEITGSVSVSVGNRMVSVEYSFNKTCTSEFFKKHQTSTSLKDEIQCCLGAYKCLFSNLRRNYVLKVLVHAGILCLVCLGMLGIIISALLCEGCYVCVIYFASCNYHG